MTKKKTGCKKGGSIASAEVVKLVTPETFDNMSKMFDNSLTMSGGMTNTHKKLLAETVDLNEKGPGMMLFHKTGGKKNKVVDVKKKKVVTKPKKVVPKKKQHGGSDCGADVAPEGLNFSFNIPIKTPGSIPPAALPSTSQTSLSMSSIPCPQKMLATQNIDAMTPMTKTVQFPETPQYQGGPFAFGGAAKKKQPTKKQGKKAPKKAEKAPNKKK
jgi:hypothetical protein